MQRIKAYMQNHRLDLFCFLLMALKFSCGCAGRRAEFCLKVLQNHLRCFRYSSSNPANYANCFIKITCAQILPEKFLLGDTERKKISKSFIF